MKRTLALAAVLAAFAAAPAMAAKPVHHMTAHKAEAAALSAADKEACLKSSETADGKKLDVKAAKAAYDACIKAKETGATADEKK